MKAPATIQCRLSGSERAMAVPTAMKGSLSSRPSHRARKMARLAGRPGATKPVTTSAKTRAWSTVKAFSTANPVRYLTA